jgi:hypothetical protein
MTASVAASLASLASMVLGCSVSAQESLAVASRSTPVSFENEVANYVYDFPYQVTHDFAVRVTGGDPKKLNTWGGGAPALVKAGQDILPRSNNDTYYGGASLLLDNGNGPVVLESSARSEDRFSSFQLVDERNANYRNIVFPNGKYTLYFGEKPARIEGEAIEVPSAFSVVIARVEVKNKDDPEDVAAAKAVFNGMRVTGAPPDEFPRLDLLSRYSPDVATEAHRRMAEVFATVPFTETIVGPGQEPGRDVPRLYHSAGTKGGWGGPDPSHSAYENVFVDENGDELRGSNGTYAVTTAEPPVDAFWSVTVYDTDRGGLLHPNDEDRYHINDTLAVRNDDGTVTFTFKQVCEVSDLNCLEVPPGRFDLTIRYFLPHQEIVLGAWRFPKVSRSPQR